MHHWRARDARTLPLHLDAIDQGKIGMNNPMMRWIIASAAARPDLLERMGRVFDRTLEPQQFVPTPTLVTLMAKAVMRGRFDVLRPFVESARRMRKESRELNQRRRLAARARAALDGAPAARRAPNPSQAHSRISADIVTH